MIGALILLNEFVYSIRLNFGANYGQMNSDTGGEKIEMTDSYHVAPRCRYTPYLYPGRLCQHLDKTSIKATDCDGRKKHGA